MPRGIIQGFTSSLSLVGAGQTALIANNAAYNIAQFSVSFWYKRTATPTDAFARIIEQRNATTQGWTFSQNQATTGDTRVSFSARSTANIGYAVIDNTLPLNQWVHYIGTFDGTNVKLYSNSRLVGVTSFSGTYASSTNGLALNYSLTSTSRGSMQIVNLKFHGHALTENEVQYVYRGADLPDDVSNWPMQEGSGTSFVDRRGVSNGTISGGSWSTDVPIQTRGFASNRMLAQDFKASLALVGSTQYATIPNIAATVLNTFSVSFWYKRIALGGTFARLIDKKLASSTTNWSIQQNASLTALTPYMDLRNSGGTGFSVFGSTLPTGIWRHYNFSFDGSTIYLYENGTLFSQTAFTGTYVPAASTTVLNSNQAIGGGSNTASMQIAALKFHNHAVTAQEATAVYNGANLSGDVGTYMLGEGAGTTAYDTSGNANNGTATATTYSTDVPTQKRKLIGDNVVNNGDFEFAPPGGGSLAQIYCWAFRSVSGTTSAAYDPANAHAGAYGMKLSTTATGSRVFVYYNAIVSGGPFTDQNAILANPLTAWSLTYWMKTNLISGSAASGARLGVQKKNAGGTTNEEFLGTGVTTTTPWTQYTIGFTTSATVSSGGFWLIPTPQIVGQDGAGTLIMDAWFDDIVLTQVPTPARILVP